MTKRTDPDLAAAAVLLAQILRVTGRSPWSQRPPPPSPKRIARSAVAAIAVLMGSAVVVAAPSFFTFASLDRHVKAGSSLVTRFDARERPDRSGPRKARPLAVAPVVGLPDFVWRPAKGARGYKIELTRAGKRILVARTKHPRLALPRSWTFGGRKVRITPGVYRWTVRQLPATDGRKPIVRAKLVVSA